MQNKKGFTIVELIVVITILAILGTIAFISLQGYSSESRDSKRISDMGQIRTGLQVIQAQEGEVPMPDEAISIGSGALLLTYQGYAGTGTLNKIRVNDEAKDPMENNYYTYTTNLNRTKFQLLGMLENGETANNNIITQTYANYENRYPYVIGDQLGTLLTTTKTPIQELGENINLLTDESTEYIPVTNRENSETGTGSKIAKELIKSSLPKIDLTSWSKQDSNCDLPDVAFDTDYDGEYDQIWAGCNSTLGAGFEWGEGISGTGTVESCYNYSGVDISGSGALCNPGNPLMSSNSNPKDFFDEIYPMQNGENGVNIHGDTEFNTIWGKLYTWNMATGIGEYENNGACPSGWKLPSNQDLIDLQNYLYDNGNCRDSDLWQCEGLGWKGHNQRNNNNNLANALKLPLTGHRKVDGETFISRGTIPHLWSSTETEDELSALRIYLGYYSESIYSNSSDKNHGYSVRCIKE